MQMMKKLMIILKKSKKINCKTKVKNKIKVKKIKFQFREFSLREIKVKNNHQNILMKTVIGNEINNIFYNYLIY